MRPTPTPVGYSPQGRPGIQGPAGPQGPQGVAGPAGSAGIGDYGYVRFDEVTGLPAMPLEANVVTAFVVTPPTVIDNRLRGPFANHSFLNEDGILRARKAGDAYDVRVRLSVVAAIAGGRFEIMVFITNNTSGITGANATRKVDLSEQAGEEEIVDVLLKLYPGTGFVQNGARIMVRCTVPATINKETLFVEPTGAAP